MKSDTEQGTQKVEETTRTYQTPPKTSIVETAIADAHRLQKEGENRSSS